MKGVKTEIIRQLKVASPKIIPIATEKVEKQKAILRGKSGFTELKPHLMTKDLRKFLESEGMNLEYATVESRRGRVEINGVKVKVSAIVHNHYDHGAFIKIPEDSPTSYENTNKILECLTKKGIDVSKECVFVEENTEKACIYKK